MRKKTILSFLLLFVVVSIQAQNFKLPYNLVFPEESFNPLSSEEIADIQVVVNEYYKNQQEKYKDYNQRLRDYHSEFDTDTFAINLIANIRFDRGGPEAEYRFIDYDSYLSYDVLLNKYYNLLRAKLNQEDKEKLKQAQLIWLKFRDSESEFIESYLSKGGGLGVRAMTWTKIIRIKNRTEHLFNYMIELTKEEYENNF